jgi:NAD(P)-dependent dehydrogenase (short-subunit alcohol dehydrogenase family)
MGGRIGWAERAARFVAMTGEGAGSGDRVALVTGASRGLGRAVALELGRQGFRVAVAARTLGTADERNLSGSLEATAGEIVAAGGEALPLKVDLDDRDSVVAMVDRVNDRWGRVDLLVNNAFYQTRESQLGLVDMSIEHLDKQIRVNLVAPMFLAKLVLPGMLERGDGAVIDMVSGTGVHDLETPPGPRSWGIGYGTSKIGMIEIAAMLASQYGDRGVRAFSVQPGTVLTEQLAAAMGGGTFDSARWDPPECAAVTIAWLATAPDAVALNGALVHAPSFAASRNLLPGPS